MGSDQSKPAVETPTPATLKIGGDSHSRAESTSSSQTKREKRTGIDLVNHKCRKKKAAYDKCFSQWYRDKFLAAKSIDQEAECGELFDIYKQCYMKHLKREFFDKGQKKVKEGSFLSEELGEE